MEKILVIASAGGHITEAMCAVSSCDNIIFVSSSKKTISPDKKIKKTYKIWDTQNNPAIHFYNLFLGAWILLRERPKAIFSTGGPIALPFALLCKIFSLKFVYLDTLSRVTELSNTGNFLKKYNLYDKFYCQWEHLSNKEGVEYIGTCFDISGKNEKANSLPRLIENQKIYILVTFGTNGYDFSRAMNKISKMSLYNDERVTWIIQSNITKVPLAPKNGEIFKLLGRGEMEKHTQMASLMISHCGIGSIHLALQYKKKVLFMPRLSKYKEFSDDHQNQIASQLMNPYFTIIDEDQDLPDITYEELIETEIFEKPVSIVNYEVADKIKSELYS